MTRNDMTAAYGRALVLADGPGLASFSARDLARTVRKHLQPASVVAMARYWSRLGVGSYAALEATRDRTAATPEQPAARTHHCSRRGDRQRTRRR
jgi:hypothetical protein